MMKHIFRNLLFAGLCVAAGCGREDGQLQPEPQPPVEDTMADMTVTASAGSFSGQEEDGPVWKKGDAITVAFIGEETHYSVFTVQSDADVSDGGRSAEFKGTVPKGTYSDVSAIFPDTGRDGGTVILDRSDDALAWRVARRGSRLTVQDDMAFQMDFRQVMHEVELLITVADGYDAVGPENDEITIRMSAADASGNSGFWETAEYSLEKGSMSMRSETDAVVWQAGRAAGGGSFGSSVLIFPFDSDDVTLRFDVTVNEDRLYSFTRDIRQEGLDMSEGGSSFIHLELGRSSLVGGEEEKPVEVRASAETLKANGVDGVVLSAFREGTEITDEATFYANGNILGGNVFKTTVPGTYIVYALVGEVRSNELEITAEAVAEGKTIVFAEGVTRESGWYDVNKVGQGDVNGDINMCWAASASNMIQWFQDRYVAKGGTLPSTAVNGADPDGIYELALMKMFHDEWDNSRGGHVEQAIPWYFEGNLQGGEYASPGSQATPNTSGGYWQSIWSSEVYPNIYHGYEYVIVSGVIEYESTYTTSYNNYYLWGNGTDLMGNDRLKAFSDLVVECFKHGMTSMTVSLNPNFTSASHATTLWGYEIDNSTGLLTRVWITDSDDLVAEPKDPLLNEYEVSIGEGRSSIKLTGDTRYAACYVMDLCPFSGYCTAQTE